MGVKVEISYSQLEALYGAISSKLDSIGSPKLSSYADAQSIIDSVILTKLFKRLRDAYEKPTQKTYKFTFKVEEAALFWSIYSPMASDRSNYSMLTVGSICDTIHQKLQ